MSTPPATPGDAPGPGDAPAPAETYDELREAFKAVMVALRRVRGRDTHKPGELSFAQYGLLFGLAGDCVRSSREIAEEAALSPATVTQMLESLEAHGLVRRTRSEQDKRVVLTELTARGHEVVEARRAQMEPRWQAMLAEFGARDLHTAALVLKRLADYLDAVEQPGDQSGSPNATSQAPADG